jgi:glycosyltransferase involved in cell wall biosynthesis
MPRITIDLRMYRHSGIGRYLRNLTPLVLPQLKADFIRVLGSSTLFAGASWLDDPRVELIETDAPIYSLAEQRLALGPALRDAGLLWVPHYNAPLLHRGPIILTIHDVAPIALPEILSNPIKRGYARLLIERSVARASAILCVSQFTADEVTTRLGTDPRKLTVTHLGLDADWPATAAPHHEPDGVPFLLFVGNVKPNKNLGLLLEAFAAVLDRLPHRLLLAGRMRGFGTGDEAVIKQAEALGDRVRFAGEVPDADLIALYAGASALVLPSLYEGFGLPLLEAMHLDCPILSSNAGSLPEIGGDAALYFDPRNPASLSACLLQLNDAAALEILRRAGERRVQAFSYTRCAEQTATVLNAQLARIPS